MKKHKTNSTKKGTNDVWLYGTHAVLAALKNTKRACKKLFITSSACEDLERTNSLPSSAKPILHITSKDQISETLPPEARHQGIAGLFSPLPEFYIEDLFKIQKEHITVVILDQVTDPQNMGAILRSASALDADALLVTERNSASLEGVLAKTASGALEVTPIIHVTNLKRAMDQLKQNDFWCIGFDERGQTQLHKAPLTGKIALVMGAEGAGIRRLTKENCDLLVQIPVSNQFSTLNVSNSAAIALYEAKRQKL